jgi:hypothetical protein
MEEARSLVLERWLSAEATQLVQSESAKWDELLASHRDRYVTGPDVDAAYLAYSSLPESESWAADEATHRAACQAHVAAERRAQAIEEARADAEEAVARLQALEGKP